jgi:hypothetical protein
MWNLESTAVPHSFPQLLLVGLGEEHFSSQAAITVSDSSSPLFLYRSI